MSDWIKVSKRLPEDDWDVLVMKSNGHVRVGFLCDFQWFVKPGHWPIEVTHWMPLPERPSDE